MDDRLTTSEATQDAQAGSLQRMVRLLRLLGAHIRCEAYLLRCGMWRGECKFCGWHKDDGRLCLIAATTGSIWDNSIQVTRVFWNECQAA